MEDVPLPPSPPQRPERQWQDFTTQEVIDALKSTSTKSAPGPDGIGWAVWKHLALDPDAIKGILNLVRRIILTGEWPQQMKESLTVQRLLTSNHHLPILEPLQKPTFPHQ